MPTVFDSLIDQDLVIEQLNKCLLNENFMSHAWLFHGPQGSGVQDATAAFAAALVCNFNGCKECDSCKNAANKSHPDVEYLGAIGSIIKVDEVKELIDKASWAPSISRKRVLVIDEAERLSESAANSLLRAIEEPSPKTIWLLSCNSIENLPVTLQSRCQKIQLKSPKTESIVNYLVKQKSINPKTAKIISSLSVNNLERAKKLADSEHLINYRRDTLLKLLDLKSIPHAFQLAQFVIEQGKEITEQINADENEQELTNLKNSWGSSGSKVASGGSKALKELEKDQKYRNSKDNKDLITEIMNDLFSFYRDVLICVMNINAELINSDLAEQIQLFAKTARVNNVLEALETIDQTQDLLLGNINPLLALEGMFARLAGNFQF